MLHIVCILESYLTCGTWQNWVTQNCTQRFAGPCTRGAGQTVKRQMVTYRIMAFGEELAGFGQVVKGLGNLSPLVTILRRTQASGKSMDLDFSTWPAPAQECGEWWKYYIGLVCICSVLAKVVQNCTINCSWSFLTKTYGSISSAQSAPEWLSMNL